MQRTQLIIVRHGQTEWNIKGIRQGNLDSRLTEKGMRPVISVARLGMQIGVAT
jgi:broad specificity phosphatase PhoE